MFGKYVKIIAMLMAICLLTACAAPAEQATAPAEEVTVESCTSEVPVETAIDYAVNSAEQAEELARAEIAKLQELGLLSPELYISDEAPDFVDFFDETWAEGPCWAVRWYGGRNYLNDWQGGNKYSFNVNLDPNTGKINYFSIEANGDEDDQVYEELRTQLDYDPSTGENKETEVTWRYYKNYGDIFPESISVDEFCTLLQEYWGCEGYTICSTQDYGYDIEAPDGSMLLAGMNEIDMNYYLTVEFECGGEIKPCYIQAGQFPGRVFFNVGNSHTKG